MKSTLERWITHTLRAEKRAIIIVIADQSLIVEQGEVEDGHLVWPSGCASLEHVKCAYYA